MTVTRGQFTNRQEKLTADMLGKANSAVLTVKNVRVVQVPDENEEEGYRQSLIINFREYPELAYWPNRTSTVTLIDQLGEEEEEWAGKRVPLVKATTQNPSTKKQVTVLWVADPDDWRDILRAAKGKPGPKPGVKRAAKTTKRGRKAE